MRLRNWAADRRPPPRQRSGEHHQVVRPGQRSGPAGDRSPRTDEVRRRRDQRQRADQPGNTSCSLLLATTAPTAATTKQPAPTQPPSNPAPRRPAPRQHTGPDGPGPIGARSVPGQRRAEPAQGPAAGRTTPPRRQAEPVSAIGGNVARTGSVLRRRPTLLPAIDDDRPQGVAPWVASQPGLAFSRVTRIRAPGTGSIRRSTALGADASAGLTGTPRSRLPRSTASGTTMSLP